MFSSAITTLRAAIMGILLFSSSCLFAQDTVFENYSLEPVLVNMSITNIDSQKTVRVTRDTAAKAALQILPLTTCNSGQKMIF